MKQHSVLLIEPTPASLSTYTFDQSGSTIGCNNTCFSLATNCTVTEGLVLNACSDLVLSSAPDWCITGDAQFTNNPSVQLTFDQSGETGAAYINQGFNVGANGFTISATVQATNTGGTPADGFAFIVQQDPNGCNALGGGGGGIAYDGIETAFVVEFDAFQNSGNPINDPDNHHIGVQASTAIGQQVNPDHGSPTTVILPISVNPIDQSGATLTHSIFINYNAAATFLTVIYDGTTIIHQSIGNAISKLNLNAAHVGFTASTGSYFDAIVISDVLFSSP